MIYVDDARIPARVGRLNAHWSHLTGDTRDELHTFAARIGLRRAWFQDKGDGRWHYDVTESKRQAAIAAGATAIGTREMGEFIRQRRAAEAAASATPSPRELWLQAGGDTPQFSRERYQELMIEHGLLIPLQPGEKAEPLPCGWPHRRTDEEAADA